MGNQFEAKGISKPVCPGPLHYQPTSIDKEDWVGERHLCVDCVRWLDAGNTAPEDRSETDEIKQARERAADNRSSRRQHRKKQREKAREASKKLNVAAQGSLPHVDDLLEQLFRAAGGVKRFAKRHWETIDKDLTPHQRNMAMLSIEKIMQARAKDVSGEDEDVLSDEQLEERIRKTMEVIREKATQDLRVVG